MNVCTYVHIYICMHACVCVCVYIYVCMANLCMYNRLCLVCLIVHDDLFTTLYVMFSLVLNTTFILSMDLDELAQGFTPTPGIGTLTFRH